MEKVHLTMTKFDKFELHLHIDDTYCGFLEFDTIHELIYARNAWDNLFNDV